mmetsp:Transcript_143107/g.457308  ORF Transcript_143107/g.457308 Transcript_143107/m.457308 type:complete len:808 (-) Transcript_143107:157-2580(-)
MAHPLLRVGVIGGGPAGLATAINLAEWAVQHGMQDIFGIVVMDTRYVQDDSGPSPKIQYGGSRRAEAGVSNRRGQVVTLQQDCVDFLSQRTRDELFRNVNESVWSRTSYNIPIREVEDRLLERAQMNDVSGVLSLEVSNHTGSDEALSTCLLGRFNIIIGADGSKSWVRRHLFEIEEERMQSVGRDLALGIEFQIPEHLHSSGLPHAQPLNVVLTVSQCRFLLNASSVTRSGFLNMQLTKEEWDLATRVDGQSCVFARSPGILLRSGQVPDGIAASQIFKPQDDYVHGRGSVVSRNLWKSIIDGLKLFGIDQDHVASIVGVELNVRYSPEVVRAVGETICFLVGDAAFQTHFWPGRGMNSVFKEAASLANSLLLIGRQLQGGGKLGLGLLEITHYFQFVDGLRFQEHQSRSLRFVCQITGRTRDSRDRMPEIVREAAYANVSDCKRKLVKEIENWAEIFSSPKRLHFSKEAKEALVSMAIAALENIGDYELKIMAVSGPWPTVKLVEVLPNIGTPDPQAPAAAAAPTVAPAAPAAAAATAAAASKCCAGWPAPRVWLLPAAAAPRVVALGDHGGEAPFPSMSPAGIEELTDEQQDKQNAAKAQGAEALEEGNLELALEKVTEAISIGGASALLYARRAQVLMKLDRPRGAANDCTAALTINPDSAKAFAIRARAYKKLDRIADAHLDFQTALKLDYDEQVYEESLEVEAKVKELKAVAVGKRNAEEKAEAARLLEENRQKYVAGLKEREGEYKEKADAEKAEKDKVESERRERVRKRESEEKAEKEKEAKADEPGVPKSHGPPEDVD